MNTNFQLTCVAALVEGFELLLASAGVDVIVAIPAATPADSQRICYITHAFFLKLSQ